MVDSRLITGDSEKSLKFLENNTIDSCITDPPYGIGMDHWDNNVPSVETWKEVYRILKPGAFCLSFSSPQLYHKIAATIEEAGFVIKDQIMWMTTTKMAKKNYLKPAHEPIVVAQKPFKGSIQDNFDKWGVGKIDTDNTRVTWEGKPPTGWVKGGHSRRTFGKEGKTTGTQEKFGKENANPAGRYPMNIIGEVMPEHQKYFYAPRATRKERGEYNNHPTPKPIALMEYLVKIYCPVGKVVVDPFCGSGTTGIAAIKQGKKFIGIDLDSDYIEISRKRIKDHCKVSLQAKQ